eukprot:SAG31_NODE_4791_length_2954_cov_2.206305_3_plen_163_part_00
MHVGSIDRDVNYSTVWATSSCSDFQLSCTMYSAAGPAVTDSPLLPNRRACSTGCLAVSHLCTGVAMRGVQSRLANLVQPRQCTRNASLEVAGCSIFTHASIRSRTETKKPVSCFFGFGSSNQQIRARAHQETDVRNVVCSGRRRILVAEPRYQHSSPQARTW